MESFRTLIQDFGEQINAKGVEANERGYISLVFDSQNICIQYDEELDEVVVFTRLTEIEPDRLADICIMMLGANMFWQGTKGATFSLEPTTKLVLLADRQALSVLNVRRLNDWLERFLNITQYWNERLINANAGGSLVPESGNIPGLFFNELIRN